MNNISKGLFIPILLFCSWPLFSQGIFSSTLSESEDKNSSILDIGGFMRGTIYTGWNSLDEAEMKTGFGESALKLTAKPNQWGKAYADIRFRSGYDAGDSFSTLDVREAYVDLFFKKFDFRFGKQIKLWGRADAFNPTQNLTPQNYFNRSPNEDDRRLGNLVLTGRFHPTSFLHLELDWVPYYKPSIYLFDILDLPEIVSFGEGIYPGPQLNNGAIGAKADIILNKIEGSLSYFSGYDPMPGLLPGSLPAPPFTDFSIQLMPSAFRQKTLGADLAVNLGSIGLRGEIALEIPDAEPTNPAIPNEELSWVLGIDRSFGSLRILAEYYGKHIRDFTNINPPDDFDPSLLQDPNTWPFLAGMLDQQIRYYNRILFDQTDEWIHSLLVRPSLSLFHETLEIELAALYNFTTEEYLLRPVISYKVADGINCTAGYEHYYGPKNTRFDWIGGVFNGPFMEIKISF